MQDLTPGSLLVKRFAGMEVIIPSGDRLQPGTLGQHTYTEIERWNPIIKTAGAKAE